MTRGNAQPRGRHHVGTLAGFKSERVAGFRLECMAGFVGIRTNDARKHGENDEWMHLLNAWREAPIYSARERAALAWTEAVTKISDHHVPDEIYDEAHRHFSEKELVDLTAAVVAINAWNRAAIAFRATPPLTSVKIAA
jgi:alkylhydroperoxidase family enzyme